MKLKTPSHFTTLGLALWTALLGFVPSALAGEPLRFLANGTLTQLQLGDSDISSQTKQRSGFSLLWFDGSKLREIPCEKVIFKNDRLQVSGPNQFPRLEFTIEEKENQVLLELVRVEGMPHGRDASILFRATTAANVQVTATGTGTDVQVESLPTEVRAYWTSLGQPKTGAAFGGITIHKPL